MNADRVVWIPLAIGIVLNTAPVNAGENEPAAQAKTETAAVESLPSAREVVDRYVAAIGGEDALLEKSSVRMTGTHEVPGQGARADLKYLKKAPDKMWTELRHENGTSQSAGFDGEVGWSFHPMMGPRIETDGELYAAIKHKANFYRTLYRPSDVGSMQTVAKTDFEGSTCYKVVVTTPDGFTFHEYFDVDSGLLVATESSLRVYGMKIDESVVTSDYREFDGIKLPTRIRSRQGLVASLVLVTDVRWNDVDESEVAPPDAIQALLEEKSAGP